MLIAITQCMDEKPLFNLGLSALKILGLIPPIKAFKIIDLEKMIKDNYFELVESGCLTQSVNKVFMVAKKT